jgi:hypothetical protein
MEEFDPREGLPAVGHEASDASPRTVVITLAGLAVGAMMVALLVYGIFWYLADHPLSSPRPNPLAETETQQMPPQPRIEEHPAVELKDLRSQEEKILTTYGWTDKDKGIVRVPIDRAMELRLQQGFPTKPGSQREKQNGR